MLYYEEKPEILFEPIWGYAAKIPKYQFKKYFFYSSVYWKVHASGIYGTWAEKAVQATKEMISKRLNKDREKVSTYLAEMAASAKSAKCWFKDFTLPQDAEKHNWSMAIWGKPNKVKIIF